MNHLKISKIYFVDDSEKQINDVFNKCLDLSIDCTCIHYVDKILQNDSFDLEFGKYQFDHFLKNNVWLNDSHYEEYLTKKK